jgi:hypothetical protein
LPKAAQARKRGLKPGLFQQRFLIERTEVGVSVDKRQNVGRSVMLLPRGERTGVDRPKDPER